MSRKKELLALFLILLAGGILRFYNLMHDEPYFFNPDERNMANAITQLKLPNNPSQIPSCLRNQFFPNQLEAKRSPLEANNCNLNPRFFAYGQFPLYLAFTSDQMTSVIPNLFRDPNGMLNQVQHDRTTLTTSFPSSIFWLRFWSALASTLTVLIVYFLSRQFFSCRISLATSLFASFTPGLIQSAHFGTTESLLTFFFLTSIYFSIKMMQINKKAGSLKYLILISLTAGLAFGSKLTGLFCLFPVFISYLILVIRLIKSKISKLKRIIGLFDYLFIGIIFVFSTLVFCVIFSPYNLIDQKDFLGSVFGYEQDVATGRYEAFYTRQFTNTVPVLFQMQKVFPYVLGWSVFILGSIGILSSTVKLLLFTVLSILQKVRISKFKRQIKKIKSYFNFGNLDLICILIFGFWIYFIPNAFLFAKWTRFMTPIFPFFAIFSGYTVLYLYQLLFRFQRKIRNPKSEIRNDKVLFLNWKLGYWIIGLLVFIGLLPGVAFFSIYTRPDSRVTASEWIYNNIPDRSYILSETANVIDIPLSLPTSDQRPTTNFYKVISFDFYHMDENREIFDSLPMHLEKTNYILIPSRRIFANHITKSEKYPLTTKYYQLLFSGRLGFEKVAEISSFPTLSLLTYHLSLPDEKAEETSTVFDHPVIRIYKKTLPFYAEQYKRMLIN